MEPPAVRPPCSGSATPTPRSFSSTISPTSRRPTGGSDRTGDDFVRAEGRGDRGLVVHPVGKAQERWQGLRGHCQGCQKTGRVEGLEREEGCVEILTGQSLLDGVNHLRAGQVILGPRNVEPQPAGPKCLRHLGPFHKHDLVPPQGQAPADVGTDGARADRQDTQGPAPSNPLTTPATTHWSLVGAAKPDEASQTRAREALEELCRAYWYPLYAFVRSRGYSAVDAQDLTQAFFARIIEAGGFASADRERGRFRSYLLGAMKHFLANEWHRAQTQKRGGRCNSSNGMRSIRRPDTPEHRSSRIIRNSSSIANGRWRPLPGPASPARRNGEGRQERTVRRAQGQPHRGRRVAPGGNRGATGMSEGAVKVAVHRLRQRYRKLLRAAIAETVSNEADLDDEMRYLVAVLRRR